MSAINRRVERLRPPDDFRRIFSLATETVVALVTVVVVSRRMSGAFVGPVEPAVPCFVATLATILSLAALTLWRQAATPTASTRVRMFAAALAVVPPLALGAALWISSSAFVGGYLAALATASALFAIASEEWSGGFVINQLWSNRLERQRDTGSLSASALLAARASRQWRANRQSHPSIPIDPPVLKRDAASVTSVMPDEVPLVDSLVEKDSKAACDEEIGADESIVQWMTRRRLADGGEVIEGAVRIDLDPAEKVGVAHIVFSPPLCGDPRAECHLLSDFDGRVRVTAAKSYGLRIEARLSGEPTFATAINVAFSAQAPPAASHAAAA
jgi:hypothetical protein